MSVLGNILWLIFGGAILCIEYLAAGVGMCITIIGIPFGIQSFKLAILSLFPFGTEIREGENAGGCLTLGLNIIWILCFGLAIVLTHLFFAVLCAITIIGIPFAVQHVKLARLALTPFGKEVL